ncbi:MAG TPA: pyridoxamine 5'-phosphate oxidase family protein [Chryseolinea sp.]|nr:pyridoxamine 5'-phosphate oxidase family protein [Chryseolinea sp.]
MEFNNSEKVKELVSRSRVGMLGTLEAGLMKFRPMSHVDVDDDGNIWFFTSKDSWKAEDVQRNPTVQLVYINESDSSYLSIEGTAYLSFDQERMRELFNPFVKAWFPKGLKDPSLALLMVHPREMEYWSNDDSKVLTYLKILTAAATGSQPSVGVHGKIALR